MWGFAVDFLSSREPTSQKRDVGHPCEQGRYPHGGVTDTLSLRKNGACECCWESMWGQAALVPCWWIAEAWWWHRQQVSTRRSGRNILGGRSRSRRIGGARRERRLAERWPRRN